MWMTRSRAWGVRPCAAACAVALGVALPTPAAASSSALRAERAGAEEILAALGPPATGQRAVVRPPRAEATGAEERPIPTGLEEPATDVPTFVGALLALPGQYQEAIAFVLSPQGVYAVRSGEMGEISYRPVDDLRVPASVHEAMQESGPLIEEIHLPSSLLLPGDRATLTQLFTRFGTSLDSLRRQGGDYSLVTAGPLTLTYEVEDRGVGVSIVTITRTGRAAGLEEAGGSALPDDDTRARFFKELFASPGLAQYV